MTQSDSTIAAVKQIIENKGSCDGIRCYNCPIFYILGEHDSTFGTTWNFHHLKKYFKAKVKWFKKWLKENE